MPRGSPPINTKITAAAHQIMTRNEMRRSIGLPPLPPQDWSIQGSRQAEQYRITPGWFGFIVEELWVYQDGRQIWKKCTGPVPLAKAPSEADVIEDLLRKAGEK